VVLFTIPYESTGGVVGSPPVGSEPLSVGIVVILNIPSSRSPGGGWAFARWAHHFGGRCCYPRFRAVFCAFSAV
jgi:hypothetical protein